MFFEEFEKYKIYIFVKQIVIKYTPINLYK